MRMIKYKEETMRGGTDITLISQDALSTVSIEDEGLQFGFIYKLMVHPMVRCRGRGQALLQEAEKEIRDNLHLNFAALRVKAGSWMEEWYRRNGYSDDTRLLFPTSVPEYSNLIKKLSPKV